MWQIVLDDSFQHADTSVGTAGSNTGVPTSPSVGTANGWTDSNGGLYSIVSDRLQVSKAGANLYSLNTLLRPIGELSGTDQRFTLTTNGSANKFSIVLRYNTTGGINFYLFEADLPNLGLSIYKVVNGAAGGVTSETIGALVAGHDYSIDCQATGINPTALTMTISDVTGSTMGYPITLTGTDSSAAIQVGGQVGIDSYDPDSPTYTYARAQSYQTGSGPTPSLTISPTTLPESTTASTVTLTGTGTSWSGSTTFAVTGGTGASISGKNVASTTSATIELIPGTAAGTLTISDGSESATLSVTGTTVAIGTFALTPAYGSIGIAVTGSSGIDSYNFYRNTIANFAPGSGNLIASQSGPSFTDTTVVANTQYYYKVTEADSGGNVYNCIPAGFTGVATSSAISLSARTLAQPLALVFIGDSITYGAGGNPGIGPCGPCATFLGTVGGLRAVTYSNQGSSGSQTGDWLPNSSRLNGAISAANTLLTATPSAQLVFSIMLGTNDSANAVTQSTYSSNLQSIVSSLHGTFSTAKVVFHASPWFSENTVTGFTYNEASLDVLYSYRPTLGALVSNNSTYCILGDTTSYEFMAINYLTDLESYGGSDGTYYLHPNSQGNFDLGNLWGEAIASGLGYLGQVIGTFPATSDVRSGIAVGSSTGSLVVPMSYDVLSGVTFDHTTQGTLTLPPANDVQAGVAYGAGGNSLTGTLSNSGSSAPTASQIATAVLAASLSVAPTQGTVGEALAGARAEAIGKTVYNPTNGTFTLYAHDGSTILKTSSVTTDDSGNVLGRE